jgi:hypothetical protein
MRTVNKQVVRGDIERVALNCQRPDFIKGYPQLSEQLHSANLSHEFDAHKFA